ncbi:MAG: GNAT family N-acetyltransferase [Clostridiaceae bacterium]
MIEIRTSGNGILLRTLERSKLAAVAELYNCSRDIWYATGITDSVSCMDIDERLFHPKTDKNEFMTGIYLQNPNLTASGRQFHLAGLISGFIQNKTIWIKIIAILPQYRRKGIGSRSAKLLLDYFKAEYGAVEVFLSVIKENNTGMLFWLDQGFSESVRFNKKLFGREKRYEVIIMQKKL